MSKLSYIEGTSKCVDEMKAFRLTLKKIRERTLIDKELSSTIEEYLEYGEEDILVLIPGYNISWFGKSMLLKYFNLVDVKDRCRYVHVDESRPLWKMYCDVFRTGNVYMISWQVFVDFLNSENLDHPQYMNVEKKRSIREMTLNELLYR